MISKHFLEVFWFWSFEDNVLLYQDAAFSWDNDDLFSEKILQIFIKFNFHITTYFL